MKIQYLVSEAYTSARSSHPIRSTEQGFSMFLLLASQWLAPQFGMASLWCSAHSLEPFLRHSSLNLMLFYLVMLGLGVPPS